MSRHEDLLLRVRAARPGDPDGLESQAAAVRTLARFAVLEAGHGLGTTRRQRRSGWLLRAAAVLAVVVLPLAGTGSEHEAEAPTPVLTARTGLWEARVERALAGDVLARERVLRGGLAARRALLRLAEGAQSGAAEALGLLEAAGPLRGADEARRLARLAHDPALRTRACRLLARDVGRTGTRQLAALLAAGPEAEIDAVAGLERVAARGRRAGALRGLLAGVAAGRPLAVEAAVRVGGGAHLARVLEALPAGAPLERAVVREMRSAPATVRSRLLRLAERGDQRAVRIATAAAIEGVVPMLAREAAGGDAGRVSTAIHLLAEVGSMPAWIALARVLDGGAEALVAERLRSAPAHLDAALIARARSSLRDAPAALDALAVRGAVAPLRELARTSRLAPAAVRALGRSESAAASGALLELAARPALKGHVLEALAVRLDGGRADAGPALLALARAGQQRAVLRVLAAGGEAGRVLLQEAARDARLGPRARHVLDRLPAARDALRVARKSAVAKKSRSI